MLPVVIARTRVPAFLLGMVLVVVSVWFGPGRLAFAGIALVLASVASMFVPGLRVSREPVELQSPVRGRWIAINGPGSKVPSHGTHSAGQTYALDLVYWPDDTETWSAVHRSPLTRRPETFPGFGQPVLAPADARVVRTQGFWRDHRSRNSWPALAYFYVEASLRELIGPSGLLGNHVVLDLGDGTYAAFAHLKRGSITVSKGQTVRAGQQIAECGNSGNSSEPHLHFQLMDSARPAFAAGLPFAFAGRAMPKNEEAFVT